MFKLDYHHSPHPPQIKTTNTSVNIVQADNFMALSEREGGHILFLHKLQQPNATPSTNRNGLAIQLNLVLDL